MNRETDDGDLSRHTPEPLRKQRTEAHAEDEGSKPEVSSASLSRFMPHLLLS